MAGGTGAATTDRDGPLTRAVRELARSLLDRYDRAVPSAGTRLRRPAVVSLGAANVLDRPDPVRRDANVHLTARAVLVGPWGGGDAEAAACGHCLGRRWQRLRGRSEREALEVGSEIRGAVDWPILTGHLLDAVWSLCQAVLTTSGSPRIPTDPGQHRPGGGALPYVGVPAGRSAPDGLPTRPVPADAALPRVSRLDLATLRVATHPLLADPLCPSCGRPSPDLDGDRRLVLSSRAKPDRATFRTVGLAEFALPGTALVNPVCGMLGAGTVANVTSPTTAPVTGSAFVRGYAGLVDVSWSGQGNSFRSSHTLALLEGLERYAGTHRRRADPVVVDSYRNLADDALNPVDVGHYPAETYRTDPLATAFSPDRPMPWVWGYSLRDDRPVLVPRRLCHYSSGTPDDGFVFATSSGCALGGCLEEAVLHGLLELVERDAFLLGWYGGARLPEIDLASCRSPRIRAMVDRAHLHGYDVRAYDNRVDLAVPVVTGLAARRDGGPGALSFAAGASLDPEGAVEAALAEVLTYIPHLPRQVRRREAELDAMAEDYHLVRQLADHSALFGLPRMREHAAAYLGPREAAGMAELYPEGVLPGGTDLLADLRYCQQELVRAGFDVIVVDQTTPEQHRMGLYCVCAIVPGLLPIDFGWRRQRALRMPRLRTAYRRAGWRSTDLAEAELHRVPHPFP
ncbi:TOMM precursor leader peptide-binding protein [Plantactinospora mayteni]|uniref:TOMM precursor leader peptide-binding protein n=1 Tax=Plantactinospora mayteni TaxID=566021 RepID=UPI001EF40BA9|nr:TOMM precursor leader peptide-binding protein [Plantactinospora mayteni]